MDGTIEDDISFDLALLDDNFCCADEGDKKLPDVVENDVSLLDTLWLNRPTIGKYMENYMNDFGSYAGNSMNEPQISTYEEPFSDTESLASSSAVSSPAFTVNSDHFRFNEVIMDDELVGLSVKDLNFKLKGYPKDSVKKYKRRRRTLKNRGYAHSCRQKRLNEKSSLQVCKKDLEKRYLGLEQEMKVLASENQFLRRRVAQYEPLLRRIAQKVDLKKIIRGS